MLIEQIIEFEVRGIGPLAVHVPLQLVFFITNQKSLKNIFKWFILLFSSKILQEAIYLIPSTWAKPQKFNPKLKILNVFWT